MAVTPFTEFSKLLDLGVTDIIVVLHGQSFRIKNTHVAAKTEKDT